jgi:hypothetical protein
MSKALGWSAMTKYEVTARPFWDVLVVVIQAVLAVVAIPSGALFLADPGGLLGAQFVLRYMTKSLPFIHDFVSVGIWFVAVYGVLPILFDFGLLRRMRFAWLLTIVLGLIVVVWIAVEIVIFATIGFTPLYPPIGGIGAAIVFVSFSPFCEEILLTPIVHTRFLRWHFPQAPDGQRSIHVSPYAVSTWGAWRQRA